MTHIVLTNHHTKLSMAGRTALKSTCQLYRFKPGTAEFPVPHGCCMLLQFNGKYFVLSNAHVLADHNMGQPFVLMGNGGTMTIGGQYYSISLPLSGRRSDDPLDVCVVHLSEATVNGLLQRGYVFLDCPADVNPGAALRIRETVLLAGYPGSSTKYDIPGKKVIAKPFIFSTSYLSKGLSIAGFPPVSHIVTRYERRRVSILGKRHLQTGPLPHGMSGSGRSGKYFAAGSIGHSHGIPRQPVCYHQHPN